MSLLAKGLLLGALQLALAAGVGAKFLYDRAHYPRVWVETAPFDPDLPIRGRYVSLTVLVDAERAPVTRPRPPQQPEMFFGDLEVRDGRLVAVEAPEGRHWVASRRRGDLDQWQLAEPVAYFIPEHVDDPSIRPPGETLWVEVTVPPTGAPRPIRLGVMRGTELSPLSLR